MTHTLITINYILCLAIIVIGYVFLTRLFDRKDGGR